MKNLSKYLSLILRHKPETVGITLDPQGWISIKELVKAINKHGGNITENSINKVVQNDDKIRYSTKDGKIRANQGHSIQIDLGLTPVKPPQFLYHGAPNKVIQSIFDDGLRKMQRHHVHLSTSPTTALQVGQRRGQATLLVIDSELMHQHGYEFFKSENGVWLIDSVPSEYITKQIEN